MSEFPTNTNVEQVQFLKPDPKHFLDQIQACAKHSYMGSSDEILKLKLGFKLRF